MILHALVDYYDRLAVDGKIAPRGFKEVAIQFVIVLDQAGNFASLEDRRVTVGRRWTARTFLVPEERQRNGSNAWQTANLLWDHYGYVLGWPKSDTPKDKLMAEMQHMAFICEVRKLHELYPDDLEIMAVHAFLKRGDYSAVFAEDTWKECAKIPGCNLTFQCAGQPELVAENEVVKAHVVSTVDSESTDVDDEEEDNSTAPAEGACIITGEIGPIARLHQRTPIPGAKSNSKIVSFQRNMGFDSFGKEQSHNAPTSKAVAFKYATALNKLLARNSNQKFPVGDATTVFWAGKRNRLEGAFVDLFGVQKAEEAVKSSKQDPRQVIALFRSPDTGVMPDLDPSTRFFVLGLAPNAARIAVRFWYVGTVGEVVDHISQHFDDLAIVHADREPECLPLWRLVRAIAPRDDDSKVPPNIPGDFMKAILTGAAYPKTLLKAVIGRIRAEQSRKDPKTGKLLESVTYARATLVKAVLAREARLKTNPYKEVGMALDLENTNIGYRLGRLFAVLEKAQEKANPGINATIRDRFYGSASSIPVVSFPQLMKLKNHHLSKLDKHKGFYERLIGEIVDGIPGYPGFPAHLQLEDQGRFAVGYYHQRQNFFKKAEAPKTA